MKQSTFKAKLNQYYGDVDQFIDTTIKALVEMAIIDKEVAERMSALGVENETDYTDILFDIIENEEDARKEGKEPVRRVFLHYEETNEPLVNWDDHAVWIEYTEDDYLYLLQSREELLRAFTQEAPKHFEVMQTVTDHFSENAELITAECMAILHTATKADCQDYFARLRAYIKSLDLDAELKRYLQHNLIGNNGQLEDNFFGRLTSPFLRAIQEIRQEEYRRQHRKPKAREEQIRQSKEYLDYVFESAKRITEETRTIVTQWYGPRTGEGDDGKARSLYLRQTKLARTKEINALQTLNLTRDNKGTRHTSTSSGGVLAERVFENNGVEVVSSRLENISLSTNTRQVLDYFLFKGIEQITHHGGKDLNRLDRQRAVETDLDEVATVFSIDRKEARKRLNDFYDETRDLKMRIHYVVKDGKGKYKEYVATVNIFDADVQEVDQDEKNATARPEDLEEGVQISFFNTGTLYHYNPKTAPKSTKAVKKGRLAMQFSMEFAKHLAQASIVQHNPKGYLVNRRKYTSAYSVQCALENHFNMNKGKGNAGIMALGTLLKDCYEIPTFDAVMNSNRNITARIKKPLLSNVQALKEVGVLQDFKYYTAEKEAISEADLLALDYDAFIKSTLHFALSPIDEE